MLGTELRVDARRDDDLRYPDLQRHRPESVRHAAGLKLTHYPTAGVRGPSSSRASALLEALSAPPAGAGMLLEVLSDGYRSTRPAFAELL